MGKKDNILVVDDDAGTIEVMSMILQNAGYSMEADQYADLDFLNTGVYPDLILMDNQVGERNGASLCLQLKTNEKTKHIPIILFSGIDNLKELASHVCANDYLAKPFSMEILLEKIETVLVRKEVAC